MLTLRFKPYELQMKHVFTVAEGSRKTTPVMLTEIAFGGTTGYGEASMPPYLGETHATASAFLSKVDLSLFDSPFLMEDILQYVGQIAPGNYAAKASVDIALHDLAGKLIGQPWYRIWGLNPEHTPNTSFTIGIDEPDVVKSKTEEAAAFKILKVKLAGGNEQGTDLSRTLCHGCTPVCGCEPGMDRQAGGPRHDILAEGTGGGFYRTAFVKKRI